MYVKCHYPVNNDFFNKMFVKSLQFENMRTLINLLVYGTTCTCIQEKLELNLHGAPHVTIILGQKTYTYAQNKIITTKLLIYPSD
jgi:hypothetical protein